MCAGTRLSAAHTALLISVIACGPDCLEPGETMETQQPLAAEMPNAETRCWGQGQWGGKRE